MALMCARSRVRPGVLLSCRLFSSLPKSRDREGRDEVPLFRYVGQRRKPTEKVFVWGFSYTGALGIPSFVIPDRGRKNPRKYQLTPYRLDTEQKVLLKMAPKTKTNIYIYIIFSCRKNLPVTVWMKYLQLVYLMCSNKVNDIIQVKQKMNKVKK